MDFGDFLDLAKIILIVIVVLAVSIFFIIYVIAVPLERMSCRKLSENIKIETKYSIWGGGCLLNIDDQWIPYTRWINNTGN